jgi:methanogenic corrinoid protein MtbC1
MLDVNGFDVLDLGVDVSQQKFIEVIRDFQRPEMDRRQLRW